MSAIPQDSVGLPSPRERSEWEEGDRRPGLEAKKQLPALDAIARLLQYPEDDLSLRIEFATDVLDGEALSAVEQFRSETAHVVRSGMQELYTLTFDLNPVATLEVGWHLWGEQYERGRFLAEVRQIECDAGVDTRNELPDHLTILLPLIGHIGEAHEVAAHVRTALPKIAKPLDEQGNPYRHLIRAASLLVAGEIA